MGYSLLNFSTDLRHNGGIAVFIDGLLPPAGVRPRAVPFGFGSEPAPMNAATGHVSITWIAQSSTKCLTVRPN